MAAVDTAHPLDTPGVHHDLDEHEYHTHRGTLSVSGAKVLLECPARYRWQQDNPPPPKREFDIGSAAHQLVLGAGPELHVIDADNWRKKATSEEADAARAAGKIPVLKAEYETVKAMADALRAHPTASRLLDPEHGTAEVSLSWDDEWTGVRCRARLDWLRTTDDGRAIAVDYKTTTSAAPVSFAKAVANFGYHMQDAWYLDGVRAVGIGDDPAFVFIAQEKEPPYLVSCFELDSEARRAGEARCSEARLVFARCTASGEWPGYPAGIRPLSLSYWATN